MIVHPSCARRNTRPVSRTRLPIASDDPGAATGRRGALRIALVIAVGGLAQAGCSDSAPADQPRPVPTVAPAPEIAGAPLTRRDGSVARALLDEASRAELTLGGSRAGLFIDLGSPDQHKYTRGSWATGWSQNNHDKQGPATAAPPGPTALAMAKQRAELTVVLDRPARELVIRARAGVAGQRVSVQMLGRLLAGQPVAQEWQVVRVPLPDGALPSGRHTLSLRAARAGRAGQPALALDWLWLAETPGAGPPSVQPRVRALPLGGQPRRALVAPTTRSYRFYVTPGVDDYLVFDYGSQIGAEFTVSAAVDGRPTARLFAGVGADAWTAGAVDLSPFAGRATALTLSVHGPDAEGFDAPSSPSGWAEPTIMHKRPEDARPERPERPERIEKRPKNVILIVVDTARADAFLPPADGAADGLPGRVDVATPNYDRLAAQSVVFNRAYNNENWTKPSVATTLSGVYPSTHGAQFQDSVVPQELELLPQYLRRRGFATAGFVANGYVSRKFGFTKGWDTFRNYIREKRPSEAERVYRDALSWLSQRADDPRPFFLYIQTIDPHVEYRVPERFTRPYFGGRYSGPLGPSVSADEQRLLSRQTGARSVRDAAWLRALYYGEITYHDEYMGEFLRTLDTLGARADTLLVITNDHGEELGERGRYGHGHSLYEEMVRAPLLVHYPPIFRPGRRIDDVVEHVDLAPTIVDTLGLPPMTRAEGQSFLPLITRAPSVRPRYAIIDYQARHRALRIGDYRYRQSRDGTVQLFHLRRDPGERTDLSRTDPIARRLCEVYLSEGLATPDKRERLRAGAHRQRMVAPRLDMNPALKREFEALGYFGDDRAEPDH